MNEQTLKERYSIDTIWFELFRCQMCYLRNYGEQHKSELFLLVGYQLLLYEGINS
jgi:hypothetical protein